MFCGLDIEWYAQLKLIIKVEITGLTFFYHALFIG